MRIKRVFNNNAISAYRDDDEVVIFGKGIGFHKKHGDRVDADRIEKVFVTTKKQNAYFESLLQEIPTAYVDMTCRAIKQAEEDLSAEFGSSTFIAVLDHINFALNRARKGRFLTNPLLWEIRSTYSAEYATALKTLDIIEEETGVSLPPDEAGTIAIHYFNAQDPKRHIKTTYKAAELIGKVVGIIQKDLGVEFDREGIGFNRLMTHLRFFVLGILSDERHPSTLHDSFMFDMVKGQYPEIYACVLNIRALVEGELHQEVGDEELLYLIPYPANCRQGKPRGALGANGGNAIMDSYKDMLDSIIHYLGGIDNILGVTHCATRLRFSLKDKAQADMDAIEDVPGVLGTQVATGTHQVLIGTNVGDVYDELVRVPGIRGRGEVADDLEHDGSDVQEKLGLFDRFTRMMSAVYSPYIPILATGGIASGVVGLLSNLGVLAADSLTYQAFYAIFYALIYFFPITLAYTAAKHFGCNEYVAAALGASLLYPDVASFLVNGETATMFGINFPAFSFSGSFIPILLAVFCMSYVERWLKRVLPKGVQFTAVPAVCLFIFVPLTIMVFGPIGSFVANGIADIYLALAKYRVVSGILMGAFFSLVILVGMHWALTPIQLAVLAQQGSEFGLAASGMGNYAILGVCLAALVFAKNDGARQAAGSSAFTLALCGISEPGLYGVVLKDKRFIGAMCLAGACGGLVCALTGVYATNFAFAGLLSFGGWLNTINLWGYVLAIAVSIIAGFVLTALVVKTSKREII